MKDVGVMLSNRLWLCGTLKRGNFLPKEIQEKLEKILKITVEKENISGLVSLSLIEKKESQRLNRQYRKINKRECTTLFNN